MKKYHVVGDYGPQGDNSIIHNYIASSPSNAKTMFIAKIKREYGEHMWDRIGERNISIFEGWWRI
jgi:hypothetical protein